MSVHPQKPPFFITDPLQTSGLFDFTFSHIPGKQTIASPTTKMAANKIIYFILVDDVPKTKIRDNAFVL